jgi:hypothetical protein
VGLPADDFALILRAADVIEADLARGLLEAAEIPVLLHGPDFDFAELGAAVHHMVRGRDLYVPRELQARAVDVLRGAWGPLDEDGHPLEPPAGWDER